MCLLRDLQKSFRGEYEGVPGKKKDPLCFRETDFTLPTVAAVAALGVVQVGGAYILFSVGIRHTPPVTASLLTGLEPIMNPLLVAAFYREQVSVLSIIGSVIVVGSIVAYNVILAKRGKAEEASAFDPGEMEIEDVYGPPVEDADDDPAEEAAEPAD